MSRSRSREPRSGSRPRAAAADGANGNLGAVDETASTTGTESTAAHGKDNGHHGLLGKIAHHLPGHHHNGS
ncbi:hypothetical protein BDZ90DRAFT_229782 [Jaminaea rosea]|uniref:Uncharacterized protein n=1 Tax=Jaminaea rosea TaxID=1569628 RepID=A0A316UZQ4_9BASI|nr:hypothetical protein BDZ90DRAFT_229782 [Jaminaea rosea]PWN30787.1 hypothetical protein BDZ90DRAFT_229782 [Jaminaea rosea]